MPLVTSSAALQAASERFRGFFQELGRTFVERDDLLTQNALALLSRQHVLMTDPPGTAKSGAAAAGRTENVRASDLRESLIGDPRTCSWTSRRVAFSPDGSCVMTW